MFCSTLLNFNYRNNPSCQENTIFHINLCIFNLIGNINLNGGAIFINYNLNKLEIFKSKFLNCYGNYGGAVYTSNTISSNLFETCFINCTSTGWGQTIYLLGFSTTSFNASYIDLYECSSKWINSRSAFTFENGNQFIKYFNSSNNNIPTYDVLLLYQAKSISVSFWYSINNFVEIVLNIHGCQNGYLNYSTFINNTKKLNHRALIWNMDSIIFNVNDCVFIKNDQYQFVGYSNLLNYNNCIFFENIFSLNSPQQTNSFTISFNFNLKNNCFDYFSNQIKIKYLIFKLFYINILN